MKREYKLISDYSIVHLEQTISQYLNEGWQLAGGIATAVYVHNPDAIIPDGYDPIFYTQAIYR